MAISHCFNFVYENQQQWGLVQFFLSKISVMIKLEIQHLTFVSSFLTSYVDHIDIGVRQTFGSKFTNQLWVQFDIYTYTHIYTCPYLHILQVTYMQSFMKKKLFCHISDHFTLQCHVIAILDVKLEPYMEFQLLKPCNLSKLFIQEDQPVNREKPSCTIVNRVF